MALGGGGFLTQNKILPGSYINFTSAIRAGEAPADRGYAAMALELDWGEENKVFEVTNEAFQKNSLKLFGYEYTHDKLKGLRDLFKNAKVLYAYRLNSNGAKASNVFGTARYSGIKGNDIKVAVQKNIDDTTKWDVRTYIETTLLESQTVTTAATLVDNDFVVWKKSATLTATAATPMTLGTNGSSVTGAEYQKFLDKIEPFSINALGCLSTTEAIKELFVQYTIRMRDEVGAKFQLVVYKKGADHEGVVNLNSTVRDTLENENALVYWTTGVIAGCAINKSNTNKRYDGEFKVDVDFTQTQLEAAIRSGHFIFHKVGVDERVLEDKNSLVSVTAEKNADFSDNQTIRVLDQIGNDMARLFNGKYLGNIPNNESGRVSFWSDVVDLNKQLEKINAIENFSSDDVVVTKGNDKKSVIVETASEPVSAMSKLYMTVVVR